MAAPPHPPQDADAAALWRRAGQVGSIGLEMVVAVVMAGSAGAWADQHWGYEGRLTLAGLVVGVGAAGCSVLRLVRRLRARE